MGVYFPSPRSPEYCFRVFIAGSYEITMGVTVIKMLKVGPFIKLSTKLSLCEVSRNLAKKLGA